MKKLIITCTLLSAFCVASHAQAPNSSQVQTTTTMQGQPQMGPRSGENVPFNQMTPEQKEQRQAMIAERQAKAVQTQYNLNAMQYKGIYDACLEYVKAHQAFRDNGKQPNQQEGVQLEMDKDAKFKKVMTEAQYTQYASTKHYPVQQQNQPQQNRPTQVQPNQR